MPVEALQNLLALQQLGGAGGSDESGLISGPIRRRAREKREGAAAEELAGANIAARRQSGMAEFGASGIDPSQIDPQRLASLQELSVTNPQAFSQELNEMQAAQGINMTPQQSVDLSRASVDFTIAQNQRRQSEIKTAVDTMNLQKLQSGAPDPALVISTANQLGDERARDLAPYNSSLRSYDELRSVAAQQSGPATVAVMFKFIKALDDSVVRDSEGRLLSSSTGLVGSMVNQVNQALGQGIFGPETVADIMKTADAIAAEQFRVAERINTDWDKRISAYAQEFMMPALGRLTVDPSFNAERQFDDPRETNGGGDAPATPTAPPEGFSEP